MALSMTMTVPGISRLETAFGSISRGDDQVSMNVVARVINISGDKNTMVAAVEFIDSDIRFVRQFSIPVSVEDGSPNFIRQAYLHLKTLRDFADATDC